MNKQYLYGIGGFVLGAVLAGLITWYAVGNRPQQSNMTGGAIIEGMVPEQDAQGSHMYGAMVTMLRDLQGKTGDDFDKAFLANMVVHHQGAVDMANDAMKHAGHQEIKDLGAAIVDTQTKEITQMQAWEKAWYGN